MDTTKFISSFFESSKKHSRRLLFIVLTVGRLERLKFVIITKLDKVFSYCIHRPEVNVHEVDLALFKVLELQNYRFRIQATIQGCGYQRSGVTVMLIPSYRTVPAFAFTNYFSVPS